MASDHFLEECKMTNSDDNFERVSRYVKKIANSELDREKRFRAIDQLRDFIRRKGNGRYFTVGFLTISRFIGRILMEHI